MAGNYAETISAMRKLGVGLQRPPGSLRSEPAGEFLVSIAQFRR